MDIRESVSLKPFNTFGIDCAARYMATVRSEADLFALRTTDVFRDHASLVLGGGSNVLFAGDYPGLVIRNEMKGIEVLDENDDDIWLQAMGGENWHELVTYAVENGWGGIENLALIPGCVGAAPIQNIGAYGAELQDVFVSLEAFHWDSGEIRAYFQDECGFGYRDSIFKNALKGKVLISSVVLRLSKVPVVNSSYGAIGTVLQKRGVEKPTIKDIYEAVIEIRRSKLPDPAQIGNAGSFFKNPELPILEAQRLLAEHPGAPHYIIDAKRIKIPAGWLIEQCGWKGFREGDAGVHKDQALVLVNYGKADGREIMALAEKVRTSVKETFGIELTPEVNMIG